MSIYEDQPFPWEEWAKTLQAQRDQAEKDRDEWRARAERAEGALAMARQWAVSEKNNASDEATMVKWMRRIELLATLTGERT